MSAWVMYACIMYDAFYYLRLSRRSWSLTMQTLSNNTKCTISLISLFFMIIYITNLQYNNSIKMAIWLIWSKSFSSAHLPSGTSLIIHTIDPRFECRSVLQSNFFYSILQIRLTLLFMAGVCTFIVSWKCSYSAYSLLSRSLTHEMPLQKHHQMQIWLAT